jgi:hypothetical protein
MQIIIPRRVEGQTIYIQQKASLLGRNGHHYLTSRGARGPLSGSRLQPQAPADRIQADTMRATRATSGSWVRSNWIWSGPRFSYITLSLDDYSTPQVNQTSRTLQSCLVTTVRHRYIWLLVHYTLA